MYLLMLDNNIPLDTLYNYSIMLDNNIMLDMLLSFLLDSSIMLDMHLVHMLTHSLHNIHFLTLSYNYLLMHYYMIMLHSM